MLILNMFRLYVGYLVFIWKREVSINQPSHPTFSGPPLITFSSNRSMSNRFFSVTKPINAHSGKKQPDNLDEILQVKAQSDKYLMEKC